MKKTSVFLLLALAFGLLISSCDNSLDILDEYKETPIVYGLLNKNDTVHYVRIQKGFLGEGNALLMAQYTDSIYYDTSEVEVTIYSLINGQQTDTILLKPTFSKQKEEGLFTDE
ncbi:MAG: hypothetical protein RL516_2041, partial [Bacteroidota bacterium]